jgi:hypothetical protein
MAIILLSDVSFKTSYHTVYESGIAHAGLSPINASLLASGFDFDATSEFWWSFPSLMTDQAVITLIPPVICSGSFCQSYFLPGPMTTVVYDPDLPPVTKDNFSEANALIVYDAPGYQIEYSAVTDADPKLSVDDDCRLYGFAWSAFFICIKQAEVGLITGERFEIYS